MKKLFLLMLVAPILFVSSQVGAAAECISSENWDSQFIQGELITVSRSQFADHGNVLNHYLFSMNEEACFNDGYGNLSNKVEKCKNGDECSVYYEIQVLLSEDQKNNIKTLENEKLEMKVTWITWGGTQQWLREVGAKGEFKILN